MSFRFNPCSPCCDTASLGFAFFCKPGTFPTCFCTNLPATLSMTSADPTCNYRMFQSCTIQYQATPAPFSSLNLGPSIYLSTESFPDPIAGGAEFFYYLICHLNQFSLTRIYTTSPYGSPYRDAILYTWLIGGLGNLCGSSVTPPGLSSEFIAWLNCVASFLDSKYPRSDQLSWKTNGPVFGYLANPNCCPEFIPGSFGSNITLPDKTIKNLTSDIIASCGAPPGGSCNAPVVTTGFTLLNGSSFPGSDLSCSVTIVGP
jgi:hypothetical protein